MTKKQFASMMDKQQYFIDKEVAEVERIAQELEDSREYLKNLLAVYGYMKADYEENYE